MAKFYGPIGYAVQETTAPGVSRPKIVERPYRGDVLQNNNKWQSSENLNDNFIVENKLSIVSDAYAYQNWSLIKYVKWHGVNWKVNRVEIARPRLILSIGGVYNGKTP